MGVIKVRHRRKVLPFVIVLAATTASVDTARGASSAPFAAEAVEVPTAEALADGSYTCTPAHAALLDARRQRIAEAPTLGDARELAVGPVRVARRALTVARFLAPGSDSLADAQTRLASFEGQVERSSSPAEVATRFGELYDPDAPSVGEPMRLADLEVENASVQGPGRCNYSTGDIIAIVIGFLLFIIPGIILLFVLC